ncbi:MAG: cation transporter [Ruminococcaceae bacterium]|nr:cation transporter [Oscillospiraceae bacterium]
MTKKAGERTLLASVLLSSPGPVVVGIGLFLGKSSTQLADFIRRTAELAAIIVSWAVYRVTHKGGQDDADRRRHLERMANFCVGAAMGLSGIAMLYVAFRHPAAEKGNVIPGLVIAVLGVVANTWFWYRYRWLNKATPNPILAIQCRLYQAKAWVDACVTCALAMVAIAPGSLLAYYMDIVGSAAVSLYLLINGAIILFGKNRGVPITTEGT